MLLLRLRWRTMPRLWLQEQKRSRRMLGEEIAAGQPPITRQGLIIAFRRFPRKVGKGGRFCVGFPCLPSPSIRGQAVSTGPYTTSPGERLQIHGGLRLLERSRGLSGTRRLDVRLRRRPYKIRPALGNDTEEYQCSCQPITEP